MSSPIIFCHYGKSDYLKYTLRSARFFNPNSDIILLGDTVNKNLAEIENVRHLNLEKFDNNSLIHAFDNVYTHIAGINHGREFWLKFSFKRYYYIYAFLQSESINSFWYFDSDVMILSDLTLQEKKFNSIDFAVQTNINGFTKSRDALYSFLIHNILAFSDKSFLENQRIKIQNNPNLALTEMATFNTFIQNKAIKYVKLNTVIDNESFDECILHSDGMELIRYPINKKYFKKLFCDIFGNIYCRDAINFKYVKMITINMSGTPTLFYRKIYFISIKSIFFKKFQYYMNFKFILNFNYSLGARLWHKFLSLFV